MISTSFVANCTVFNCAFLSRQSFVRYLAMVQWVIEVVDLTELTVHKPNY
jgi:hypothetical protein